MAYKKIIIVMSLFFLSFGLLAQKHSGAIKGVMINRADRTAISDAKLTIYKDGKELTSIYTEKTGKFIITDLADGLYRLRITSDSYLPVEVNVLVSDSKQRNLFNIGMTSKAVRQIDNEENELDTEEAGVQDSPVVLYNSNDVFNNIAAFNFSSVRFRPRGYANESQDVYLAGIKMNDAVNSYSPYSLWSGLNDATRTKQSSLSLETASYGIGGYNGLTNIDAMASNVRKGFSSSVLTNSLYYRLRLMATYSSGILDNGWSYSFSASARLGGNDWVKGVYYRSFAYYFSAEKIFNPQHRLGFIFMASPGERGAQNASTQEVYDLVGDNMYNSNWGYQNGKVRNAKVRINHEPIAVLKYDFSPSHKFSATATILYRFGKNAYTALDWYDAPDPRPDYYRNLPSYFYNENEDLGKSSIDKYNIVYESWIHNDPKYTHIDWDRIYNVNKNNKVGSCSRSKYIIEERRQDQQDLNFALNTNWRINNYLKLNSGINAKVNRTEFYKKVNDLLGGRYYVDIDQFAERDFASDPIKLQNNLDYYLEHGHAKRLKRGDKFGYDYYAHVMNFDYWNSLEYHYSGLDLVGAFSLGYNSFWREGLTRKGLFVGLDREYNYLKDRNNNYIEPIKDYKGDIISSFGKSKVSRFFTYTAKLNMAYNFNRGHRLYANIAYISKAPTFNKAFISPRTRNSIIEGLRNVNIFSTDLNYNYRNNNYNIRASVFYTDITNQTDVMSFYDDSQRSFTNFAMTGINQRHMGMELGFLIPSPINNLSLQGALSLGRYIYTSNPYVTQTLDNSSAILIDNQKLSYWMSHPKSDGTSQQHYVAGSPQVAASLGLKWNKNYWFVDLNLNYFAKSYLSMNPLQRTDMASAGKDKTTTIEEIEYMASQEEFKPAFLLDLSVGKSWYINYKYMIGCSFNAKNLLNNKDVRTGGFEQSRLINKTKKNERFYKFDPKYFYMAGFNYMLNIYFRF